MVIILAAKVQKILYMRKKNLFMINKFVNF